MSGSDTDRRQTNRAQVLLKVEYREPQALLSDYLTDLAEGGLFIRTEAQFEIGQRIAFSVSFPTLLDPVDLEGVVRWRSEASLEHPEKASGVGVEFIFPSESVRRQVALLVANFRQAPDVRSADTPFRVLLVEDNQFVHDLFKHAVRRFHREMPDIGALEISSANNGQEALQHVGQQRVDLAIVDHFLPVMSGSELVVRMRNSDRLRNIPILVVSVGGEGVREEALRAGADLYLDKPVLLKQLLTTLRFLVAKHLDIAGPGTHKPNP